MDWIEEELQGILRQLGASFSHILRDANVMADALLRERALRSSL